MLSIHRKFDEAGDINITGYSVATVAAKSDGVTSEQIAQGKRYRFNKRLAAGQGHLFDKAP